MANSTTATTTRQLSADDAAFLLDVLHHLEAPLSVNIRQIASSRNATPNAIHQRVFKIRHRYGINIQGGSGRIRDNRKIHRRRKVDGSPDSDLPESDQSQCRAIAAPPAPGRVMIQPMTAAAAATVECSPREASQGIGSAKGRGTKHVTCSPNSADQPELHQVSHIEAMTADGARMCHSDLNHLTA